MAAAHVPAPGHWGEPVVTSGHDRRTTVVVATRNRRCGLLGVLKRALVGPERPPVIVVDNASVDGTPGAVRAAHPEVTVVELATNLGAAARTVGVEAATTPYIAFADDDSWWAPGAITRAGDLFDAWPRLALIASRILVGTAERPDAVCAVMASSPLPADEDLPGPAILGFLACGAAVRRDAFLAVGGFTDLLTGVGGEEGVLALDLAAAGWGLAYAHDVVTHHHPSPVRDVEERRVMAAANELVATWLHRPAPVAWAAVAGVAEAAAGDDGVSVAALRSFGCVLPRVLEHRRPLPDWLEGQVRLLERAAVDEPACSSGKPMDEPACSSGKPMDEAAPGPGRDGPPAPGGAIDLDIATRVTVVVITHNRCEELLRTLGRLTVLPGHPPVVVVDNGSTDGTAIAVRAMFPSVTVMEPGANLGAVGRNLGVARATTPYVAFADDDTWWDPEALATAASVLDQHPDVAVLTGHIVMEPSGEDDPIDTELRESPVPRRPGLPGPALMSFLAGASVVRRSAFEGAGGFSRRLWLGGEEELLAADLLTAGWWVVHRPDLVVHHQASVLRDPHLRRRHGIRNTLWFTWLRRPAVPALRRTVQVLRVLPRDRISAAAVADAVRGLPWVLRERRPVPAGVERGYRLLEDRQLRGRARRYVS